MSQTFRHPEGARRQALVLQRQHGEPTAVVKSGPRMYEARTLRRALAWAKADPSVSIVTTLYQPSDLIAYRRAENGALED